MSIEETEPDCEVKKLPTTSSPGNRNEPISFALYQSDISSGTNLELSQKDLSGLLVPRNQKLDKIESELKIVQLSWDLETRYIRQNMDILRNEINMLKTSLR